MIAFNPVPIARREPDETDLNDPAICVIDVGDDHNPEKSNFDHHQFPRHHEPTCSLSLVLQHNGLYRDARQFCEWLETAEWFDCRGAKNTADWLGVERDILGKLSSPIDITLLRRFALSNRHQPGEPIWEVMRMIGQDLIDYLKSLRARLDYISQHSEIWDIAFNGRTFSFLFMPRTEPLPEDPSMGLGRFIESAGKQDSVIGMIYPDRRGSGYGLSRYNDNSALDFTRIEDEPDVHFAHKAGFVAKSSATDHLRLRELARKSIID